MDHDKTEHTPPLLLKSRLPCIFFFPLWVQFFNFSFSFKIQCRQPLAATAWKGEGEGALSRSSRVQAGPRRGLWSQQQDGSRFSSGPQVHLGPLRLPVLRLHGLRPGGGFLLRAGREEASRWESPLPFHSLGAASQSSGSSSWSPNGSLTFADLSSTLSFRRCGGGADLHDHALLSVTR